MTEPRNLDRVPCDTRWGGYQFSDPCDDCGHMIIQHIITTDARCIVCEMLDAIVEMRAIGA